MLDRSIRCRQSKSSTTILPTADDGCADGCMHAGPSLHCDVILCDSKSKLIPNQKSNTNVAAAHGMQPTACSVAAMIPP